MANSNSVFMDYQSAMRQARVLHEEAVKLKNLANNDLDGVMISLRNNWSGSSADAYYQKCRSLSNDMLSAAARLDALATSIESAAREAKAADERATAIAKKALMNS